MTGAMYSAACRWCATADAQSPAAERNGQHLRKVKRQTPVLQMTACPGLVQQLLRHAAQRSWGSRWVAHNSCRHGSTCGNGRLGDTQARHGTAAGLVATPADLQDAPAGALVCWAEGSTIASCLHRTASTAFHAAVRSVMPDVYFSGVRELQPASPLCSPCCTHHKQQ